MLGMRFEKGKKRKIEIVWFKDFIKSIGYEIMEKLTPSSCMVYKIRNKATYRTIKISMGEWGEKHIFREDEILNAVKGIDGVANSIEFYDNIQGGPRSGKEVALVKEYIKGVQRKNLKALDKENKRVLIDTVEEIHKRDFVNLDLWRYGNIVVDKSGKPYLVDLGLAYKKGEISKKTFKDYKKKDLIDLETLLFWK